MGLDYLGIFTFFFVFLIVFRVFSLQGDVKRTERKLDVLLRHFHVDPNEGSGLSDRVKELARDPAKKIEAIKAHREETGASLAEAKNAVDAYLRLE